MNTGSFQTACLILAILLICSTLTLAQELKPIQLLKPQMDRGRPLMSVLKDRKSSREFSNKKLPLQELSNLLWAAFGVNRPESGMRTAPSAMNRQEIDIYVAMKEGLYLYDAKTHTLKPILTEDIRAMTGVQPYVRETPVNLIYVADFSRMGEVGTENKIVFSAADAGFIGQNVYLYCASEGLANCVRASIDKPALEKAMKLRSDQRIILAQAVGYPKE